MGRTLQEKRDRLITLIPFAYPNGAVLVVRYYERGQISVSIESCGSTRNKITTFQGEEHAIDFVLSEVEKNLREWVNKLAQTRTLHEEGIESDKQKFEASVAARKTNITDISVKIDLLSRALEG